MGSHSGGIPDGRHGEQDSPRRRTGLLVVVVVVVVAVAVGIGLALSGGSGGPANPSGLLTTDGTSGTPFPVYTLTPRGSLPVTPGSAVTGVAPTAATRTTPVFIRGTPAH